jgi:hypothetical protein
VVDLAKQKQMARPIIAFDWQYCALPASPAQTLRVHRQPEKNMRRNLAVLLRLAVLQPVRLARPEIWRIVGGKP